MQTIKTVADLKRLPVGTKILTINGAGKFKGTIRKIEHIQSNALRFEGGSWLMYPKATELRTEEDRIIIESRRPDGSIWSTLEYKIIE